MTNSIDANEAAIRRGTFAAAALAVLFLTPVAVIGVISLQDGHFHLLVLLLMVVPLIPAAWTLWVTYLLVRRRAHWQLRNTRALVTVTALLATGAVRSLFAAHWGYAAIFALAVGAVSLGTAAISRAGAALGAPTRR
ncbi:hypothetical protein [Nocardia sp. NPDC056000]|uniref:hypothetical protein n=1 Tax=Nocardia sp. NPDC056000 TaxID=3345674 RepID=UPI0035DA31E0